MTAAPSQEKLKLLGELSAHSHQRDPTIMATAPDWPRLEQAGLIQPRSAQLLLSLHQQSVTERAATIVADPDVTTAFMKALTIHGEQQPVLYLVTLFYDVIRDDTAVIEAMLLAVRDCNVFAIFNDLLERSHPDSVVPDKAAFLLASLIARAPYGRIFEESQIECFIRSAARGGYSLSEHGRLDVLKNILKNDRFRDLVWNTRGAPDAILSNLATKSQSLYPSVFAVWLLSFNDSFLIPFLKAGAVTKICNILKETKTEKVVRVCIHTILNFLANDSCVEEVIQQDAVHTLTLLEYEKWRDQELYVEISGGLAALQKKIKQFSNFDRYCRELESGKLSWSYLHSEKFWHENVTYFEEKEFKAVHKLAMLLRSSDSTTLAIACHDLGEFARLYPTGKKVIQKLHVKESVMALMSNKDRDVGREALLCVQKMMLDRWQDAAAESGPALRVRG